MVSQSCTRPSGMYMASVSRDLPGVDQAEAWAQARDAHSAARGAVGEEAFLAGQ